MKFILASLFISGIVSLTTAYYARQYYDPYPDSVGAPDMKQLSDQYIFTRRGPEIYRYGYGQQYSPPFVSPDGYPYGYNVGSTRFAIPPMMNSEDSAPRSMVSLAQAEGKVPFP